MRHRCQTVRLGKDCQNELRDRQVTLILALVDDGEAAHFCGICGFVPSKWGEPCLRCALIREDLVAVLDEKRVGESVEDWWQGQKRPHPFEAERDKLQRVLDALEACPPLVTG